MNEEQSKLGKLVKVKNKKPKGNESKEHYLATSLEFPETGVHPVMFLPDELERPIKRAIKQRDDLNK